MRPAKSPIDIDDLERDLLGGHRAALSRAITLIESTRSEHRALAGTLLDRLAPRTGGAVRIGLSGVPGAGKSTLIDAFGTMLTGAKHRVAVLTVDPSSVRTRGSILGDKTRMARLATDANAFIRPTPTAGTLGGVAARTREAILLCEAAGFDVVIVETVGVGQSEIAVSQMVDVFVLLMLPGAGDELQGIKKGILETADIIALNKADGEDADRARRVAADLRSALNILAPRSAVWKPPVLATSGLDGTGLDMLWETVEDYRKVHDAAGLWQSRRADQNVRWLWSLLDDGLRRVLIERPAIAAAISAGERDVKAGTRAPTSVAGAVLDLLKQI